MSDAASEDIKKRLEQRKREVCAWLERNRHRRGSLTHEDADRVAYRVGALLDRVTTAHGSKRGELAGQAFNLEFHAAHEKLRYYAYPRQPRGPLGRRTFIRTPAGYCQMLEQISKVMGRPYDDLALEVFGEISEVRSIADRCGTDLSKRRFIRLLEQLAERLARTHHLADYYRALMTNGVMRDLTHEMPRFNPNLGGEFASPHLDCADAALPVTDAMHDDPNKLMGLPYIFQGRLPAMPLYRIRASRPSEVVLHFVDGGGRCDLPRKTRAWVAYHWEVRLGVGPRNNGTASAMFFENAMVCLIHLRDPSVMSYRSRDEGDLVIYPEDMYSLPSVRWSDSESTLRYGERTLRAKVLDVETGEPFDDGDIHYGELIDVSFEACGDEVEIAVAGPVNASHFLVDLPEIYSDRLQYLYPSKDEISRPLGGFFPTGTIGEWVESELRHEGSMLERDLGERAKALWDALATVREERWAAAAADQAIVDEPLGDDEEVAEYLLMDARGWREGLGLSQKEAARLLGVVPRSLREYERGARDLPHSLRLAMLFCRLHPDMAQELAAHLPDH